MRATAAELAAATARLAAAGCVAADEEAAELLAHARGRTELASWLARREVGEPLAWIVGSMAFAGVRVRVHPGVYVPRPQSEELVARAASVVPAEGLVADLCCGCGALSVAIAARVPGIRVLGVDLDRAAVANARANALPAVTGDLGRPLRAGSFDAVVAVAPYVPTAEMAYLPADVVRFEPRRALDGGADGLDVVRRVVADASALLRRGGWLGLEVGGDQDAGVVEALAAHGFKDPEPWHDDDGDLRGVGARRG